ATQKTPGGDMDLELEQTVQFPESMYQLVKTPMGEMTTVMTPAAGFVITPMGTQDLPASMRGEMRFDLLTILKMPEKYTFAVSGTEKVGDVNATVLTVTTEGGSAKWYVDPATGRVLRTQRNGRRGEQITDYTDWKAFDGLNVPAGATITINGEKSGTAVVKSVEVNPTIDPKIFVKPEGK